jgi:hypothetical protein
VFAKELLGESERAPSHEALAENANSYEPGFRRHSICLVKIDYVTRTFIYQSFTFLATLQGYYGSLGLYLSLHHGYAY